MSAPAGVPDSYTPDLDKMTPRLAGSDDGEEGIMRVKNSSNVKSLASAIAHALYQGKPVTLRAIGAGAVSQAMKSLAISRSYAGPAGIDIAVVPAFKIVVGDKGDTVSAMTFRVVRLG